MNRRWKIFIAIAVVGLAGFLVWAFRSSATPPLTIHFTGYRTNITTDMPGDVILHKESVLAVFGVTNHSTHPMSVGSLAQNGFGGRTNREMGRWLDSTNYDLTLGPLFLQLPPGHRA